MHFFFFLVICYYYTNKKKKETTSTPHYNTIRPPHHNQGHHYYHDRTTDGTGNKCRPYNKEHQKKKPRDIVIDVSGPQVSCSFIFMFIFLWFFYTRESCHIITSATTTPTPRLYSEGMGTGLNDEGCQKPRLPHTVTHTVCGSNQARNRCRASLFYIIYLLYLY